MIRGRRSAAAAFALLISVAPAALWAQGATIQQQFLIYAGPLHRDYLGCLNCDQFDPNSVWDGYSAMGWGNAFAEASHFANYRAAHGRYSACDAFAADPPILIDRSLNHYGVLSVSTKRADSVCGPKGVKSICEALKRTCNNGEEPLR
jgi:hypothetical protein